MDNNYRDGYVYGGPSRPDAQQQTFYPLAGPTLAHTPATLNPEWFSLPVQPQPAASNASDERTKVSDRRRTQNRMAQRAFRARKKNDKDPSVNEVVTAQAEQILEMQAVIEKLKQENQVLREQLKEAEGAARHGVTGQQRGGTGPT